MLTDGIVFQFAVLVTVVVAVSARVYPAKTGAKGGSGHSKGGSDVNGTGRPDGDRFHLQSDDGQYVFGHTAGNQVSWTQRWIFEFK